MVPPVKFSNVRPAGEGLVDVPPTVINLVPCTIEGPNPEQVHSMPVTNWECMITTIRLQKPMTLLG